MQTLIRDRIGPVIPTESDAALARSSGRCLAKLLQSTSAEVRVQIPVTGAPPEAVVLPMAAVRLLVDILTQMAQGHAVTLIPDHAELTTQQAADLLNVSRPFFVKLLDEGRIPFRKVGTHRRVAFKDALKFKRSSDAERRSALRELPAEGQRLNLGY